MTETVVHVKTLEQWKSVLDVWFKQGYEWHSGSKEYQEDYFDSGSRGLWLTDDNMISMANTAMHDCIEYADFLAQQKEDNKTEMYYVTQEQLDWINNIKEYPYKLTALASDLNVRRDFSSIEFDDIDEKDILRYLGGDETVEFKVKEQLYRLWAIDQYGDKVYFKQSHGFWTSPATQIPEDIFTAPLEEIKKWQTPAWEIEKVQHGE